MKQRLFCAVLVLLVCLLGSLTSFAESDLPPEAHPGALSMSYTTEGREGYAAGTIRLTAQCAHTHTYALHYANADGPLSDYAPIATLTLAGQGDTAAYSFTYHNALPLGATRILALDADTGTVIARTAIPRSARITDEPLYRVGLMSDLHIVGDTSYDSGSSRADYTRALDFYNSCETAFNAVCGDITLNGYAEDFARFAELSLHAYANVYSILGNHDVIHDAAADHTLPEAALGIPQACVARSGLNYAIRQGEDIFIFLQLNETGWDLTDDTLDFLEATLSDYADRRVFILEHIYLGQTGNIGALGSTEIGIEHNTRFRRILAEYNGAILLTGHSHLSFEHQRYGDEANCAWRTTTAAHRIHIPSLSKPRVNQNGVPGEYKAVPDASQGYLVEVYADYTIFRGIDFTATGARLLPDAQYIIPHTAAKSDGARDVLPDDDEFIALNEIAGLELVPGTVKADGSFATPENRYCMRTGLIAVDQTVDRYYIKLPVGMSTLRVVYYDADGKGTGNFAEYLTEPFSEATRYCILENLTPDVRYIALRAAINRAGELGDIEINFAQTP